MRALSRAAAALAVGAGLTVAPAAASAHLSHLSHRSQRSGYVYVNDNSATHNSVAGFRRNSDGSLTPLPGTPFTTGGAGTGIAIGSQGSLQPAFGGRFVLAVDAGSNQISVLAVRGDGSLRRLRGAPVSSRGLEPVSIAVHGNLVYVANAGIGESNYSGFVLGADGALHHLPGSTIALPDGAQPGDSCLTPPARDSSARVWARRRSTASSLAVTVDCTRRPARRSPPRDRAVGRIANQPE